MQLVCRVCVLASRLLVFPLSWGILWCQASILSLLNWCCILAQEWLKAQLWCKWATLSSHLWGEWQLFRLVHRPFCSPLVAPVWWSTRLVFFRCSSTMAMYRAIHSSFALYSRWICLTIIWESLLISNLVATKIRAKSNPVRIVSYSASLLEAKKLRRISCSISSPVGDCSLNPNTLNAPSTWSVHHYFLGQSIRCVCFLGSSAIKSTITCPFKDNRGWYLIPYWLNSITHFNIRPDKFNWCKVTWSSWFVSTITC